MNAFRVIFFGLLLTLVSSIGAQETRPRIAVRAQGDSLVVKLPWERQTNSWCLLASTDLKEWEDLGEMLEINGRGEFPDPVSHMYKRRYYKALHKGKDPQRVLDRNRARWERSGIENYDFNFRWNCFCIPDFVARVRVEVRGGAIHRITRLEDGRVLDPSDHGMFRTVDGLFDFLQNAIDSDPHSLTVKFDPRNGVPRTAWVDYIELAVDEERGFVVEDFRVVETRVVQIVDTPPSEIQLDPFVLESAVVENGKLLVTLTHSGGCADHEYELFMSPGAFLESSPVQANLFIRHNANGDRCRALIRRELSFDLGPIGELYGEPGPILLNVHSFFEEEPGERIQVRWEREFIPPVVITDTPAGELKKDAFWIEGVQIDGDVLTLSLSASGGCAEHDFELFMSPGAFLKTAPPQAELYIRHDGHDDPCDAIVYREVQFDLRPISELYGRDGTIVLNIYDFLSNRRQVNYEQ